MVAQHPLELREVPVNKVGGVRYPHLDVVIPGEKQWQVAFDAQVCAAQPLVRVMAFAGLRVRCPFPKVAVPFCAPLSEHPLKRLLVCLGQQVYYLLEFHGGLRFRMLRDILAYGLLLVELAQLHLLAWKHIRKAFAPVKHHRWYLIPHAFKFRYALRVEGVGLILHEVPQQVPPRKGILEQHHSVLAAPVCGVHHYDCLAGR